MPLAFRAHHTSLANALKLSDALAQVASSTGQVVIGSVYIVEHRPSILLGKLQRPQEVVALDRCHAGGVSIYRRGSSGTGVYVSSDGAALWVLALPTAQALYPDTLAESTINRNIRGFLQGFSKNCALTHYFGREWISTKHRPTAVAAIQQSSSGGVQLELWCGANSPIALPHELCARREQNTNRWLGKSPASWAELASAEKPLATCLDSVSEFAVSALNQPLSWHDDLPSLLALATDVDRSVSSDSATHGAHSSTECPIGWIDVVRDGSTLSLGGDIIASPATMARIAEAASAPSMLELQQRLNSIFATEIIIGASATHLANALRTEA